VHELGGCRVIEQISKMKSYHLKWSSHLPNMGLVFATLYQTEGLSDVTLACEDGTVRAHKLLLSTCSDYFLELFLESSSKRTVVVLPNVKVADLKVIISFIYTGEVNVSEDGLSDLLEVAEMLGVRGLKAGGDENKSQEKKIVSSLNLTEEKTKEDDKADEGIEVENSAMSEDSCSNEEEPQKIDTSEMVPSISITRVQPRITSEETQICSLPVETVSQSPEHNSNPELNKSSQNVEAKEKTFPLSLKMEHQNPDNNYIISDDIAIDDNDDDIEEDIEEETDTPVNVKSEPNMSSAFSSHFQPMMSQHSQYSQYFHSPSPYNFPSRTPLPSSPPFSNPLVSMSNLAAMYQQQQSPRQIKEKTPQILPNHRPLEHYRDTSQEGKVPMDLLPEDINAIMAQSTTPFCPICNKDCGNFPNLRSHLQVHNSIRPYACTYCEAKFARVSHLNRHIRTHTGERPFACERCGKSFARQDKLKLHMDRHISRETKTDLMNHLISAASTNPPSESPNKKLKLENNISLKQELSSNSSTPTSQLNSPVANSMNNFNMIANNSSSLWGGFPMYNQNTYQPVYPGMVPQYLTHNVSELHNVMKIGECSIKPLGQ